MPERLCRKCNTVKDFSEFVKTTWTSTGVTSNCKSCRNKYTSERRKNRTDHVKEIERKSRYKKRIEQLYGITREQYDLMLKDQNGRCAICETEFCKTKRKLAVDHCHSSGKVRGLLCSKCNIGLGHFNDNSELLYLATKYLENYG